MLGTDDRGRDVFARLVYGFRISVLFAFVLTAIGVAIGIFAGAVQGYFSGRLDLFMQRVIEVWSSMPELYLLIIFASIFQPSIWLLIILVSLFGWMGLSDYVRAEFLRGRNLDVFLFGERVEEPVDHPMIRPSVNAVAATYDLALANPELASAVSPFTGQRVNRFLHIAASREDVVMQNKMQRRLGQLTGTCFQRCVGMDALNSLHSVTFEIDEAHNTAYHRRFLDFVAFAQSHGFVIGGAMTDVKGDRGKAPHAQADPDLYVHITRRSDEGVWISGAKAHQTGCINSHWMIVMPTIRLGEADREALCGVFETVFNHRQFTGRSGAMFKYEGLGCIYWHMV